MEILRCRNIFTPIRSDFSRTHCILCIFYKIKNPFTEIVIEDQKHSSNTCACQKRKKNTFPDSPKAHYSSQCTKQLNVSRTHHSENEQNDKKQRHYTSHSKITYSCNSFSPDTSGQPQNQREQDPSIINFRNANIHNHGYCGNYYRKKVKKSISYHLPS